MGDAQNDQVDDGPDEGQDPATNGTRLEGVVTLLGVRVGVLDVVQKRSHGLLPCLGWVLRNG